MERGEQSPADGGTSNLFIRRGAGIAPGNVLRYKWNDGEIRNYRRNGLGRAWMWVFSLI